MPSQLLLPLDEIPPSLVDFYPDFLSQQEADRLLAHSTSLEWQHNTIRMFGKMLKLPRLEAMFGDSTEYRYFYSGSVELTAKEWTDPLKKLRDKVERATGFTYQVVIGNQYRNGREYIGYHSDNEPSLGKSPAIASISLGATRIFKVKRRGKGHKPISFELTHGSLILMKPGCQETCIHALMKTTKPVDVRVNWTFRPWLTEIA
ncbi:MAG: alpha-ketoglutarate-dependent dioxygenase AlkB family protein [Elainellaceae cyanobacterium]